MKGVLRFFMHKDDTMDDLLKQCALAYEDLMSFRYVFTLGLKRNAYTVRLGFPEKAFHHLAGLHKTGFAALRHGVGKSTLKRVLAGEITQRQVEKAGFSLADRWEGICRLRGMIESNRIVFQYRKSHHPGSIIDAEYLISDQQTLFFISGESPASIFGQRGQGYEKGCARMTVLRIEREDLRCGSVCELYRNPHYKE